ncbi:hypothetical protein T03_15507 [Trichinella britovi]|uniref:Peptidase aspartic putative domain-containing protein n=1 Tax=Trichinella britovi TaxID=45882 RepID=A0A0V1CHE1_TRIBR|nr:hypothetical protein T03_15507 [Trichinella britovi]
MTRFGNPKLMTEHHIQAIADLRPNGDKTLRELHDELVTHVKSLRALNRDTSERLHHGSHKFSRQDEMEMKKKECRRSNKVLSANVATGNLCSICRKNHQVEGCPLSLKSELEERDFNWITSTTLGRQKPDCSCGKWYLAWRWCTRMEKSTGTTSNNVNEPENVVRVCASKTRDTRDRTYLQTAKAYLYAPNGNNGTKVMCLFDTGSQRSFLTKGVADSLGLTGSSERELLLIVRQDRSTPIMSIESATHWNKIHRQPGNIIDYYYHFIEDDRRGVDDDCLVSVKSTLEWILCGQNSRTSHTSTVKVLRIDVQPQYDCEKYRRFWKLESIEIMDQPEVESPVERSMTINRELLSFHNARYVTRLFSKRCSASLNNYHAALKRFEQLKAGLRKEPTKKREYENILREYIDNGYVEEIGNLDGREGRTWHLPHRAVFRVSLNERLDPGSPIIADLVGILLRFRQFKIGIHADITKMFLQIELHPEDRDVTRFVWRKQGEEMPCIYRFCRLFFGLCCSPYLATIAVQYLAVNHETEYQETSSGQKMVAELTKLLKIGSFDLSKWSSNCADVLSPTPQTGTILATGELTGTRLFPFLKNQCGDVEGTGER